MIDICLIVPTHNRPEKLAKSLSNWVDVFSKTNLSYRINIIDNSTDDRTNALNLQTLHPSVSYKKRSVVAQSANLSIHMALLEVDTISRWYWLMGDDDYILLNGLIEIKNSLFLTEDLEYIHATDATFPLTQDSEPILFENLLNEFGLLELTSFMSSQIFSKNIFFNLRESLRQSWSRINWEFNFNHSIFLSLNLIGKKGLVIPKQCVLAQSHVHGHSTALSAQDFRKHVFGWMILIENLRQWPELISLIKSDKFYNYRKSPIVYYLLIWQIKIALISKHYLLKGERDALRDLALARLESVDYYLCVTDTVIASIDRFHYSSNERDSTEAKKLLEFLLDSLAKVVTQSSSLR